MTSIKEDTYRTGQLSDILGVSRDALRYYEEQGIVKPKQNEDNHYRQYDFYDLYTIMAADFYKKRNLSIKEVKKLQSGSESQIDELGTLLDKKAKELEADIQLKKYKLQKIKETKQFCKEVKKHLNQHSIRRLPAYEVIGEISDFHAFLEYPNILNKIDLKIDDILSKIVRKLTFNENGLLSSKMYIVEKAEEKLETEEWEKCIYTIVEDGREENEGADVKQQAFEATLIWAKERGLETKGVAYAATRLITYLDQKERVFLEVFIPIDQKHKADFSL